MYGSICNIKTLNINVNNDKEKQRNTHFKGNQSNVKHHTGNYKNANFYSFFYCKLKDDLFYHN